MLQQTRVAAVIPYYELFLERFPDVHALAKAPEEEVLRLWSGLGYYTRARNLQKAAQQIVAEHGGVFPKNEDDVLALPGIGAYTAAAILSIALDEKKAVLDGNVARVIARIEAIRGDLREAKRWQLLQKNADQLLDPKSPGDWNQALMELGAMICTPSSPQCLLCPVAQFCEARKLGIAELLPETRKKRASVHVILAAAVFVDKKQNTLLLPPPVGKNENDEADHVPTLVSKMWHFPAISVHKNADTELRAYLKTMLPRSAKLPRTFVALAKVRHAVTYRKVSILPFRIDLKTLPRTAGARIIALDNFFSLPVSNLTRKVANAALAHPKSAKQKG